MADDTITCAYSKCLICRPLYRPMIELDDGTCVGLAWAVCRQHRWDLAELLSTRSRYYRMLVDEFRERLVAPPPPGDFHVEFEEWGDGL